MWGGVSFGDPFHVGVWGQSWGAGPFFSIQGSLPALYKPCWPMSFWRLSCVCLPFPTGMLGLQTHYCIQLFTWVLGFRTQVLAGAVSAFIHWAFSSVQEADFKPWNLHSLWNASMHSFSSWLQERSPFSQAVYPKRFWRSSPFNQNNQKKQWKKETKYHCLQIKTRKHMQGAVNCY